MQNKLEKDPAVFYDSPKRNVTEPQNLKPSLPPRELPLLLDSANVGWENRKINYPSLMKATPNQNYKSILLFQYYCFNTDGLGLM